MVGVIATAVVSSPVTDKIAALTSAGAFSVVDGAWTLCRSACS